MLALCVAASRSSTTTGHFAQFQTVNENNCKNFVGQRKRSIWMEWLRVFPDLCPLGSQSWREQNKTFNVDALSLLKDLKSGKRKPAVVYADPPYTADHYSRYYHLYETLLKYDYPELASKGRYRSDRYASEFSIKTKVGDAMDSLVARCAELGSSLVMSYPSVGLLPNTQTTILQILRRHYRTADIAREIPHLHSSLGGSTGKEKSPVTEHLYLAST